MRSMVEDGKLLIQLKYRDSMLDVGLRSWNGTEQPKCKVRARKQIFRTDRPTAKKSLITVDVDGIVIRQARERVDCNHGAKQ